MTARTALRTFALVTSLLLSATAHATIFRAYLASDGIDANPCTLPQPCRLLPAALTAVADGGEIWMLDSANYNAGTVTVGKSVSIVAVPGVVGSIVALNGGPAVQITAGGLKIALRNVAIGPVAGSPAGTSGVVMTGASNLSIENSLIAGLPVSGVDVNGIGTLKISDTTLRNMGSHAISLQVGAQAVIASSRMIDNVTGGVVAIANFPGGVTNASITDSVISGSTYAVHAGANAAATARISVIRSTLERSSQDALRSETAGVGTAEISVGGSMVVNNNHAWYQSGAGSAILSLGNNQMTGNVGSIGTKSLLPPQ